MPRSHSPCSSLTMHPDALSSLRQEISDLRARLASSSNPESPLPAHEDSEWRSKYERLFESHRRVQKTNGNLEDKLLRIVDKFESEKNQMTRDLAAQTQKLVEAKMTIQRLSDQNRELQADLNLSITLLRNKPSSFVTQRVDTLPVDVRNRLLVKEDNVKMKKSEGKKIRVDLPILVQSAENDDDGNDRVSAAILAKVLEERDKERRAEHKFCIDVGTQTHGWHFPTNKNSSSISGSTPSSPPGSESNCSSGSGVASPPSKGISSRKKQTTQMVFQPDDESCRFRQPICSNIMLTSVIHPSAAAAAAAANSVKQSQSVSQGMANVLTVPRPYMTLNRSATFSALETDI